MAGAKKKTAKKRAVKGGKGKGATRARRRIKQPGPGPDTKLTPEVQEAICLSLRLGNFRETAAAQAGVSSRTLRNWLRAAAEGKDPVYVAFAQALDLAEATGETRDVAKMRQAGGEDWRSIAWRLERRFPKRWGARLNVTLTEELEKLVRIAERVLDDASFGKLLEAIASEQERGSEEPEG